MAYVELHTTFVRNRKIKILARTLDIKKIEAQGLLTALWCNVLEQSETGNVTKWTPNDFAEYAEFEGDPISFYNALINSGDGFVDEIGEYKFIHDWWDYAGRYLKSKYKNQNPNYLENIEKLWDAIRTVQRLPKDSQQEALRPHYLSIYLSINQSINATLKPEKNKEQFEEFWKAYPTRNGKKLSKADTKEFFVKNIKDEDANLLQRAVVNYANSKAAKEGYAKDAIRFLRKDYWREWIMPEISAEQARQQEVDREQTKTDLKQAYSDLKIKEGFLGDMDEEDQRRGKYLGEVDKLKKKIEVIERRLQA